MAPWLMGRLDDGEPADWRVVWLGAGSAGSAYSAGASLGTSPVLGGGIVMLRGKSLGMSPRLRG